MPSLSIPTINFLVAADGVLIPVRAQYLSAKDLEQLLQTINKARRQINPKLKIGGILLTTIDSRTNKAKEINPLLRKTYGSKLKVSVQLIAYSITVSNRPELWFPITGQAV